MPIDTAPFALPVNTAAVVRDVGLRIVDEVVVAGCPATYADLPASLSPGLRARLRPIYPQGLWRHQSQALARLATSDVAVSTRTASGKTLIAEIAAADLLERNPDARVICLYPAKALIEDQAKRLRQTFAPQGIDVAVIHGGISLAKRMELLEQCRIVLMTPDVMHAWLMSNATDPRIRRFLGRLGLVFVDEAHAYAGVFGTNMAYLFRRLEALAHPFRILASSATMSDAQNFFRLLTGREFAVVDSDADGSPQSARHIVLLRRTERALRGPALHARLLQSIQANRQSSGLSLAFADSRRGVEMVMREANMGLASHAGALTPTEEVARLVNQRAVLPYRAGYEDEDRVAIQKALSTSAVDTVVATSALELGIDIGDIDVVALLAVPPTMKSARQRMGRAGRRSGVAVCFVLDERGTLPDTEDSLAQWLERPSEPSRLYLENRFVQYAHAVCAARESLVSGWLREAFSTLPDATRFCALIDNEVQPSRPVEQDLFPMKQVASSGGSPHHAFPLRIAGEREYQLRLDGSEQKIGCISPAQAMREAFPGALYVHLGQSYRVLRWSAQEATIRLIHAGRGHAKTEATAEDMVFPRMDSTLRLRKSATLTVFQSAAQANQRVRGFVEVRGGAHQNHVYGPGSTHRQTPLERQVSTTAVGWLDDDETTDEVAQAVLSAYCALEGVHEGEVTVGRFHHQSGAVIGLAEALKGFCLYDNVHGGLRLTERLLERFAEVVDFALGVAEREQRPRIAAGLHRLLVRANGLPLATSSAANDDQDVALIVPAYARESAVSVRTPTGSTLPATIVDYRYTPRGLAYVVRRPGSNRDEVYQASTIEAERGAEIVHWNSETGEIVDIVSVA